MERILAVLEQRLGSVRVVVENLHNPHNMSAVLRSCEAMGIQNVDVVDEQKEFKVARGITKGSHKWLTLKRHDDFATMAKQLKSEGFSLYAAMPAPDALPLDTVPVTEKIAIVFGNEHGGVSDTALEHCDGRFVIPMQGFVESFNVSVAVAISIYDLTTRARKEREDGGRLTPEQKAELLNEWLPKSSKFTRKIARIMKGGDARR